MQIYAFSYQKVVLLQFNFILFMNYYWNKAVDYFYLCVHFV